MLCNEQETKCYYQVTGKEVNGLNRQYLMIYMKHMLIPFHMSRKDRSKYEPNNNCISTIIKKKLLMRNKRNYTINYILSKSVK